MGFFSKYAVSIVMIPVIIGGHYGWYKLQEMDSLVSPEERENLSVLKMVKDFFNMQHLKNAIVGNEATKKE